ncbi:MAG: hypothetical protein KIG51_09915 [Fibrobacter sp.]|nr:hypothetical protein [Fibrobacter sp.]
MKFVAIALLGLFSAVLAKTDTTFTFNAITFSEHYPYFEVEDYDSLPDWAKTENVLAYDPDWETICYERFELLIGGVWLNLSRIDSSVAVAHVAVKGWTDAEYYPGWQFWRVGDKKKYPMTSIIIDEFKMYHECGFLKMPWAQADSIIRHIVFDFMLDGDTTADWEDGDYYNATGLEMKASFVVPGEERKNPMEIGLPDWKLTLPSNVIELMKSVSVPRTNAVALTTPQVHKLVPGKFAVGGLASETPFQLFSLNGKVL